MTRAAHPQHQPEPPHGRGRRRGPDSMPAPAVDERLVMPESRFEVIDGEVFYVAPCDEPHGTVHASLSAILKAHAAPGYQTAVDMLTRTAQKGDMAPDASVFPLARDARTGGRQIEALAFEVVSTESLPHAATKARRLLARGVRRVFAIDVERRAALEWSQRMDGWEILSKNGSIADVTLVRPMAVAALVDATLADGEVAAALLAKKEPVLMNALAEAAAEAARQAKAEAVLAVLAGRGIHVKKNVRERILAAGAAELDAWLPRVGTCGSAEDLLRG
jgi:Uma2 family endonuclease